MIRITYLETKVNAYRLINQMFSVGKKPSSIVFVVQTRFGFGSKMVYERLKLLHDISSKEVVKVLKKRD